MIKTKFLQLLYLSFIFCLVMALFNSPVSTAEVNMSEVRALAKLPVNEILKNTPVIELNQSDYWSSIHKSTKPVIVMFYSNQDQDSQNLATLVRYIASDYSNKILFCSFKVVNKGKPGQEVMKEMNKAYSLDKTPGVLFYDNDKGKMVLEEENYEVPTLKEYRTPGMLLWKTYYSEVRKTIDQNILD
ncbi:MAG TPA: hypothetical protein VNN20_06615 [Thermodesulfobacteriota bacterium]|nr:hypothetical protein [Thermodesulfobacteriota bacterium]